MNADLAFLLDRWRDRALTPTQSVRLTAALAEPAIRSEVLADVTMQRRLAALLRTDADNGLWEKVTTAIAHRQSASRQLRIAVAVDRRISAIRRSQNRSRLPHGRSSTRLVLALVLATAACVAIGFIGYCGWFPLGKRTNEAPTIAEAVDAGDAQVGMILADGVVVRSGPHGHAMLRYPDGTSVELESDTQVISYTGTGQKVLRVTSGELHADVTRQPAGQPMRLETPHAVATIRGTSVTLMVRDVDSELRVLHGLVDWTRGKQTVEVHAGEFAIADGQNTELVVRPLSEPKTRPWRVDAGTRPPAELMSGTIGTAPDHRRCFVGVRASPGQEPVAQVIFQGVKGGGAPLFQYRPNQKLRFDCWYSGNDDAVLVSVWDPQSRRDMVKRIESLSRGRWTIVTVPLGDLRAVGVPQSGMSSGFPVWDITISIDASSRDAQLYVDHVQIVDP